MHPRMRLAALTLLTLLLAPLQTGALGFDLEAGYRLTDPLSDDGGPVEVGLGQQDGELVAAVTAGHICAAELVPDGSRYRS